MILPWDAARIEEEAQRRDRAMVASAAAPYRRAASDVNTGLLRASTAASPTTGAAASREAMIAAAPEMSRLGAAGAEATAAARRTANENMLARDTARSENAAQLLGLGLGAGGSMLGMLTGALGGMGGGGGGRTIDEATPGGMLGLPGGGANLGAYTNNPLGPITGLLPAAGSIAGTSMGGPLGAMAGGALGNAAGGLLGGGAPGAAAPAPVPAPPFDRGAGSEDMDATEWARGGAAPRGLAGSMAGPLAGPGAVPAPAMLPPSVGAAPAGRPMTDEEYRLMNEEAMRLRGRIGY